MPQANCKSQVTPNASPRRAFTLIELLVVITIIVLLLSILLPSIKNAQELSYLPVCSNQLRQISVGTLAYASDYGNQMPPGQASMAGLTGMGIDATWRSSGGVWPQYTATGQPTGVAFTVMNGYLGDPRVLYCPAWTHPYAQYDVVDGFGADLNSPGSGGNGSYGGWPAPPHAGPITYRDISYLYRSSFGVDPNNATSGPTGGKPPSLRARTNVFILSDHWFTRYSICWGTYSHRVSGGGYEGLRLDGSCDWISDPNNQYAINAAGANVHTQAMWGFQEKFWQMTFENKSATALYTVP